jgi:hypothetical protein
MVRRSRAGQVALVIVLTARRDEVQRTSGVRFDTRQRAEVCQTQARKTPKGIGLGVRRRAKRIGQIVSSVSDRRA